MSIYTTALNPIHTPQSEAVSPLQQENNAGGYSFVVDDWARLQRFLILGSEGGTYYVKERALTLDNAAAVRRCVVADPLRTVRTIAEVSQAGNAPKNSPAIFALAICAASESPEARRAALDALPDVCRIGTHLFEFVAIVNELRGWGRGLRRGVGKWYAAKTGDQLALQLVKYQQRNGWSHRDVLRLCHLADNLELPAEAALRWAVAGSDGMGKRIVKRRDAVEEQGALKRHLPDLIAAYEECKTLATDPKAAAKLIVERGLAREMVPTELLAHREVWEALLVGMPMTAMIRNLGKMTSVGLIAPLSDASRTVAERLGDVERLRRARMHPIALMAAQKVYARGCGVKGSLTWGPVSQVTDALDAAFYAAFGAVPKTGKRHLLALDVSGSMGAPVAGIDFVSCREAATAMAMVALAVEPNCGVVAFSSADAGWSHPRCTGQWASAGYRAYGHNSSLRSGISTVDISPRMRIGDAMQRIAQIPMGGTDCALPMMWAMEHKVPVDVFHIYTDNETWQGDLHAHVALKQYRQQMGIDAKLAVVAMEATEFTIADPSDAGMIDVAGFDTATPQLLSEFACGLTEDSSAA